ncbi:alpha/beta hydrolase [Nocardioides jiangxiensis]|uniref:Alpha/beta fold hydrolase n=1 Tax=Nocardioides jiangxiensis TaxID=3064524 RepID=A0ABT9B2L5_9ACTN|nr:alpha/beta fold hydrolase [Nocardioides sp. WY-20]MDO7869097.1 alpha/beta fold hydrolase [Nocardioides sp. WY-20]
MPDPLLTRSDPPTPPRAVALVLHGGAVRSTRAVDGRSASWQRARALQRALSPDLHAAGVAVWLLRFRVRGWNDPARPSPLADARWALETVRRELDLPVALLGHSMGARTAVHVADDPSVRGVVGLAPWLPQGEPVAALRDRHLVVGHGRRDRITSFAQSRAYVERSRTVARSAEFHDLGDAGHYLLRASGRWNAFAAGSVLDVLAP